MLPERLDPRQASFFARPDLHQVLAGLRRDDPLHPFAPGQRLVTRYADVRDVGRDPARFCSSRGALVNDPLRSGGGPGAASLLQMDPPEHALFRRLVRSRFSPRAVARLEPRLRQLAAGLVDGLDPGQPFDLVAGLAAPFPLLVICELLGIPDADRHDFRRWSDATIESTDRPPEETAADFGELVTYLQDLMRAGRERADLPAGPEEDLTTVLARAEVDEGDGPRPLRGDEFFVYLLTLLIAGNETTRTLISGAVETLARHPDQRRLLAAEPDRMGDAVEECLRWVTPVEAMCRTAVADTELEGGPVEAGDYLVLLYASANRDEAAFGPTADRFDVTRPTQPPHLGFGFGEHVCLGASLARLEARILLSELLARFPEYELAGPVRRVATTIVAGVAELPVLLTPPAP